jgi:hypothetical protein
MKIVSGILILITVYLNVKHGWSGLMDKMSPEETKMLTDLNIGSTMIKVIGVLSLAVALLTLIPQTFFVGNLLNAMMIVYIMALALRTDNIKTALIEIPFLIIPLVLIYLGHPFGKK